MAGLLEALTMHRCSVSRSGWRQPFRPFGLASLLLALAAEPQLTTALSGRHLLSYAKQPKVVAQGQVPLILAPTAANAVVTGWKNVTRRTGNPRYPPKSAQQHSHPA